MKIKCKIQKNLPQLIEWAMDNDIKHRVFESNPNFDGVTYKLGFDKGGDLYFEESLTPTLLFTVEVEEEVTEDTIIPEMLTIYNKGISHLTNNKSLNGLIKTNLKSAYILNDDLTMTLIWTHEKGLVEQMKNKIDENLVLPKLIEIDVDGVRFEWNNKTINEIKNYQTKTIHAVIYGEFKLVWEKHKGLVE